MLFGGGVGTAFLQARIIKGVSHHLFMELQIFLRQATVLHVVTTKTISVFPTRSRASTIDASPVFQFDRIKLHL